MKPEQRKAWSKEPIYHIIYLNTKFPNMTEGNLKRCLKSIKELMVERDILDAKISSQ